MGQLTKQLIGKEDLSIQYNTNDPEQFSRLNSVGGTINLYQIPDIWTGTGRINVGQILKAGEALLPWVDVRDYGAKGDGVTDDRAAIQAAITACPTNGTVYIPESNYLLSTFDAVNDCFLYIDKPMNFLGPGGKKAKFIIPDGAGIYDAVQYIILAKSTNNVRISGIYLYGNDRTADTSKNIGIDLYLCDDSQIDNCIVERIMGSAMGTAGTSPAWGYRNTIKDNKILSGHRDGFAMQFQYFGKILNNYAEHVGPTDSGFPIIAEASYGVIIKNNFCTNNKQGIVALSSDDALIEGNKITSDDPTGIWPSESGIYVIGSRRVRVIGNYVYNVKGDAITLNPYGQATTKHIIMGNTLNSIDTVGDFSNAGIGVRTSDNIISNNFIWDTGGNGILLTTDTTPALRNLVSNNFIYGNAPGAIVVGIKVEANSNYNILENNNIPSFNTPIIDAGTGTRKRGNTFSVSGAVSGRAILVAGTVTVSTTEIATGDNVILSPFLLGGTPGYLNVGTIVNVTSFVINSSSNTDTSTIYWEIRH